MDKLLKVINCMDIVCDCGKAITYYTDDGCQFDIPYFHCNVLTSDNHDQ